MDLQTQTCAGAQSSSVPSNCSRSIAAQLALALALAGCGGGSMEGHQSREFKELDVDSTTLAAEATAHQAVPESPMSAAAEEPPPAPAAATDDEILLLVEDETGDNTTPFLLSPVRGRGYQELKITLVGRRSGQAGRPAKIRAACRSDSLCEYELAKKYRISLSEDSVLKLVPRGDFVAVVAKTMKVGANTSVNLTFSDGAGAPIVKRIEISPGP